MMARLIAGVRHLGRVRVALHDALRGLRVGRGAVVLAFVLMSLTMAAGTVTFSIVDTVALRPLPYTSPERLVGFTPRGRTPMASSLVSAQQYFAWLEGTQTFESLAAARRGPPVRLQIDGGTAELTATRITANLFQVLGIPPAAGRFFGPQHEQPGGPNGVILSHGLWLRMFGGDAAAVGRLLRFDDGVREVVGVLPDGVWYPMTATPPSDLYIPYVATDADRANAASGAYTTSVVGRLRPGIGIEQARADVARVSPAIVLPLHEQIVGTAKGWLLLVLAAIVLVLCVACANVANLLLTRAITRGREFAIREALGASRRRLAASLLFEGLIVALGSAAVGIIVSFWGVRAVVTNLPPGLLTRVPAIAVDGRVLGVSIGVAMVCGLVFASMPAWRAASADLAGVMKRGGGLIIGSRSRDRSLSAFLVVDIAFACILLVSTALVVTSFILITTADLGFDRRNVMTFSYQRSLQGVPEADQPVAAAVLRTELLERVHAVPEVTNAAIALNASAPLSGGFTRYSITIPGVGETPREDMLETNMVTSDYFRVMGMQLLRGRMFEPSDGAGAPLVMLINDAAARRFFPGRDPIGQVVEFRGPTTIVGVLRNVHFEGPEVEARPAMYTPIDQEPFRPSRFFPDMTLGNVVVRTNGDARGLATAVREAVRQALGGLEPSEPRFIDDDFRALTASRRFNAGVMAAFGLVAVAIGAIGVYGATSFVVAQQIRAIGLRMALGASRSRVIRGVLGNALGHVGLGVAIGLVGAWAVSTVFTSFVFGIRTTDPAVYAAVGGSIAVLGLAAALVPALRAARLDPLTVLRHE